MLSAFGHAVVWPPDLARYLPWYLMTKTNVADKARIFNDYFHSVLPTQKRDIAPPVISVISNKLDIIVFSEIEVVNVLKRLGTHHQISGRAYSFCCLQPFFYLREKTIYFFGDQRPTIFYVLSKNFFVGCFPYYVGYHLVFFLINIFLYLPVCYDS